MSNEYKLDEIDYKLDEIDRQDELNAHELRELSAAPQPPALGGEPEVMGYGYKDECTSSIGLVQQGNLEPLVRLSDYRAHLAPQQAEIERLKDEVTTLSCIVDECGKERDQLKARCDELEGLLRDVYNQNELSLSFDIRIDAALSKPAGSEKV